jgi:hypothetical protein
MMVAVKAAAIAQTVIKTYESAQSAYASMACIPYYGPVLGAVAAAAAIAGGMARVAAIRSQSVEGYAQGGYTGPGGKYQIGGLVHKGEGVLSQEDIRALGGPSAFESFRASLHRGCAGGGMVDTVINHRITPIQMAALAPANRGGQQNGAANQTNVHISLVEDAEKSGKVETAKEREDMFVKLFVSNIHKGGQVSQALETHFALRRQGR